MRTVLTVGSKVGGEVAMVGILDGNPEGKGDGKEEGRHEGCPEGLREGCPVG